MTRFYWVLGAVAVVGIGAVGYSVGSNALGTVATAPVDVEGLDDMQKLVELAQGVTKGDPDAPVTIVEFGDYQCPSCQGFGLSVKPQIDLTYVETGKANFVFYDFPIIDAHPHAFLAARAVRCAGDQDKYWEYGETLFRNQPNWASQTADNQVVGMFVGYAQDAGMDADAFESCVRSDRHADVVTANMRLGYELGVPGTPSIMVSGQGGMPRRLDAYDFRSIRTVVESFLSAAEDPGN